MSNECVSSHALLFLLTIAGLACDALREDVVVNPDVLVDHITVIFARQIHVVDTYELLSWAVCSSSFVQVSLCARIWSMVIAHRLYFANGLTYDMIIGHSLGGTRFFGCC
ncbi:hypothetical protein OG21DRAFT_1508648 [Imleria badia]|nr:hypothetical protein OG21DRAFT_1508648 [Imleria badia]